MAAGDRYVCPLCESTVADIRQHMMAKTVHSSAEVLSLSQVMVKIGGIDVRRIAEQRMKKD